MLEMSLLSCPVCLKPHFQGVDALRSSLINVATTHISCPVCNELLLGLDKLTIHLFSHISSNRVAQDCNSQTNATNEAEIEKETAETHFNIMEGSEMNKNNLDLPTVEEKDLPSEVEKNCVSCDICNFHFSDDTILDLHQKLLHQTSPDHKTGKYNYHCHLCSKQFKMRGSLMVHLRVAHFGFIQNSHKNSSNYHNESHCFDNNINPNNVKLKASYEANNKEKLVSENAQIVLLPSQSPTQVDKRKIIGSSSKCQENKQWECEVCLKLFTTKYFLKKHKRLHTGEMPYYCSQCNKYFTFQQSYHKHMLYHSDDKPHICSECGRAFKELSTLHNHERIHSGERPFSCETCGKCFRQRVSYLVHRRIHTGVMPYKCTACNKSFRYKVSQRSHKCPVNPPGCVVRTPDLVEKLIQNQKVSTIGSEQNADAVSIKFDFNGEDLYCIDRNVAAEAKNAVSMDTAMENFGFLESDLGIGIQNSSVNVVPNYVHESEIRHDANDIETCNVNIQETNKEFASYHTDSTKGDVSISFTSADNGNPDFFALILSPVLSDVQSLCLSNYTNAQNGAKKETGSINGGNDALQTINEESFKELLYGPSSK